MKDETTAVAFVAGAQQPHGRGRAFCYHTPRLKRLEGERQALLDAIRQAQLLLSVKRWAANTASC